MDESPTEISLPIAEAVSDALGRPIEELPPLSEAVNLDGLDAVVTADKSHDVAVVFSYAGLRVFVHSDSAVYVWPGEDDGTDWSDPACVGGQ